MTASNSKVYYLGIGKARGVPGRGGLPVRWLSDVWAERVLCATYEDSRCESARLVYREKRIRDLSLTQNFIKQLLCTDSVIQTVIISGWRETINTQIYIISSGKEWLGCDIILCRVAREDLSDKGLLFFFFPFCPLQAWGGKPLEGFFVLFLLFFLKLLYFFKHLFIFIYLGCARP